jgi:hypothetical protein
MEGRNIQVVEGFTALNVVIKKARIPLLLLHIFFYLANLISIVFHSVFSMDS